MDSFVQGKQDYSGLIKEFLPVITSGAVHQLANIISGLSAQLEMLCQRGEAVVDESPVKAMRALLERAQTTLSLLNTLFTPAASHDSRPAVPISKAVECIKLCSSSHVIRVEKREEGDSACWRCGGDALFVLTFWLLLNGVRATPNGGLLELEVERVESEGCFLRCSLFFTDQGVDLWLEETPAGAECLKLLGSLGGRWGQDQREGKEVLFFEIPLRVVDEEISGEGDEKQKEYDSGEVVFVIEDEEAVRSLLIKMLIKMGHLAFGVGSCEEALSELKILGDTISVLLIDVGLPGVTGPHCYRKVVELIGDVPVIYVSGASHPSDSLEPPSAPCLMKPIIPSSLQEALAIVRRKRRILSGP